MISRYYADLKPGVDWFARWFRWLSPNVLTLLGVLVALPGLYWLASGELLWGSLFMVGGVFDMVDGAVARLQGKVSKFGGVFDASLDRLVDGGLLWCLGMGGFVMWWLVSICIIVIMAVSYIKAKAEAVVGLETVGRNQFSVGVAERGERLLLLWLGIVAQGVWGGNWLYWCVWVVLGLSIVTLVWRGWMVWKVLGHLDV